MALNWFQQQVQNLQRALGRATRPPGQVIQPVPQAGRVVTAAAPAAAPPARRVATPSPPTPMYESAVKSGLVTAPIVGGTEMIQTAGMKWVEEQHAAARRGVEQMEEGIPKKTAEALVEIGTGALRAPLSIQAMGLAIPAVEWAVRHPKEFGAAFVPGTVGAATGLATYAKEEPLQFGGEMVATGLLFYGPKKAASPVTKPIVSRGIETWIKVRTPPEHRAAVGAVSDIGRYTPGLRSTIEREPDLSRVLNIGKKGPVVEDVLSTQPHTIYGSTVQVGQMPASRIPSVPKDLDVFVQNPQTFAAQMAARLGPEYIAEGNLIRRIVGPELRPHAIDTHAFPPGYPMEGAPSSLRVIYGSKEGVAPRLPFDFTPREVFKGPRLTQEYLYTQVGRKAASVIGEPEGRFRWRFGPEEHRMKDIPTLIADAEWLAESARQQLPEMGIVRRAATGRKIRKIEDALNILRQDPLVRQATIEPPIDIDRPPTITLYTRPSRAKGARSYSAPFALAPAATAGVSSKSRYPRSRAPRSRASVVPPRTSPTPTSPTRGASPSEIPSSKQVPSHPSTSTVPSIPKITTVPSIPKITTTPRPPPTKGRSQKGRRLDWDGDKNGEPRTRQWVGEVDDWLVENPVHDLESMFGIGPKPRTKSTRAESSGTRKRKPARKNATWKPPSQWPF